MIKLLIFDFDGTLVDSAGDIIQSVNSLLLSRGELAIAPEKIRRAIGGGLPDLIRKLFNDRLHDSEFARSLEADLLTYYDRHLLDTTRPYPGAEQFLESCRQQVAIVSNKHEQFVKKGLAGLGLDRFSWREVLGGNSLPQKKPHPLPLLTVMAKAGAEPSETIMIGDGLPDVQAAHRAGTYSIACEFGYSDPQDLRALEPTMSITSFDQLAAAIASIEKQAAKI